MALFSALAGSLFIGGTLLGTVGSAALATVVATTLNLIVGATVSLIGSSLLGALSGKKPGETPFGVKTSVATGGDVGRSFMIGRGATAGSFVYGNTWGEAGRTPNAYFTQVFAVSDIPVRGLRRVFVAGEAVTLDTAPAANGAGFPALEYRVGGVDHLWVKFYDGSQSAADSFLVGTVSSADRPYDSDRVGMGIAYAICTARVNRELFSGVPSYRFEIDGIRLYDPTRDSSAGGVGSHRWDSPATWGGDGDDLPAVQIYNLIRGVYYGGEWVYGLQGIAAPRLPAAHWRAQIEKCRAAVSEGGGTAPRYTSGGEIAVGEKLADAIEALLTSCNGRLTEAGGFYKLFVGEPEAAVGSFTDDDIISTSEQTFAPFFGLAETINGVTATYPSPSDNWNTRSAPPVYRPELEAEDGDRRLLTGVELPFVYRDEQVQRLMRSSLLEARRARRHTFALPPEFWRYEPGDVLSWTSERNGYVTKLFRVDGVIDLPDLDVVVDLTEIDPRDYDWDSGLDFRPVVDGPVTAVRPAPQPILDWRASPASVPGPAGEARRPALLLEWDGAVDDVAAVAFEVRRAAGGDVVRRGRADDAAAGGILISQNIVGGTAYEVRGRYVPASPRATLWSSWLAVTAPDIRLTAADIADGIINTAKFAQGIEPVGIVTTLPGAVGYGGPAVVFNATDGRLYRYASGLWTAAVPSVDISGQITEAQIADAAIAVAKLRDGAVSAAKIAARAVTAQKIGAASVTEAALATGAVSAAKIAARAVVAGKIATGAVTAANIATGAVVAGKIATGAVSATKIATGAVVAGKIATGAVSATKIATGAVVAGKIATGAVTAANIAAGAVVAGKIAAGAITATQIAANSLTAGTIAAGAIGASEIAAGAVVSGKLASNSVIAAKIAANAVTADKINVSSLSAISANLGAIQVGSANIANLAVTSLKIGNGAVITNKLGANAVTRPYSSSGTATLAITVNMVRAGFVLACVTRTLSASTLGEESSNGKSVSTTLKINGVAVGTESVSVPGHGSSGGGQSQSQFVSISAVRSVGAGSIPIEVFVTADGGLASSYRCWAIGVYA